MDTESTAADLDIGPAVAKLRFFRFAEFVLIFLAIIAVSVFAVLFVTRDETAELAQQFGSSFSHQTLNLVLLALGVVVIAGFLTYRAAGTLRAPFLRRHKVLLPVTGVAFLIAGIVFGTQFERMMHKATMIRLFAPPSAFELINLQVDPLFAMQPPAVRDRIVAELRERIRQEKAASAARASKIEQVAVPRLGLAQYCIGALIACALGLWGLIKFIGTPVGRSTTPMSYLDAVEEERDRQTPPRNAGQPVNRARAYLYLGIAALLLAVQFVLPEFNFVVEMLLIILLGATVFILLFRAKQYFQVSADSLLGSDKRPPILFLRSFSDDSKVNAAAGITHEGLARLIDFSLETRLAGHFMSFGPFIAVGSPQEAVPQLGAARARLSDEEWQAAVTNWMQASSAIVMYAGTTSWVGWELERIIEGGWTDKLIVLFPPVLPFPGFWQKSWLKRQKGDIDARFQRMNAAFSDTQWSKAWDVEDPETIVCARFDANGAIAFTRSERRSKDAYDLASKIAHLGLLNALPAPDTGPGKSNQEGGTDITT